MKSLENNSKLSDAIEKRLEQYGHPAHVTVEKIRAHSSVRVIIGLRMSEEIPNGIMLSDRRLTEALELLEELLPCPRP